jgi:hypothetical protein
MSVVGPVILFAKLYIYNLTLQQIIAIIVHKIVSIRGIDDVMINIH